MKIIVTSCDKNADIFEPFHYCMEKYWPNHPEIIYITETIVNPYYRTIICNKEWNRRIEYALNQIEDEYILMMCDDVFIRNTANIDRINYLFESVKTLPDFCHLSFISNVPQRPYLTIVPMEGYINIGWRTKDKYYNSTNCTIWKKDMLLKCLSGPDTNIWKFEDDPTRFHGRYYLSINNDWPINWGREDGKACVALFKGRWTEECVNFFNSENFYIDFSKRGIVKGGMW